MLWIALHLPRLPLEIFLRGAPTPEPFAVIDNQRILACDSKAAWRGVRPGMPTPSALALAPHLSLKPRDAPAETEALLGLAAWATQFTPAVALAFPDGLLLEISGSLKLLGGLETVINRLRPELAEMGFTAFIACAPTARAANWLARSEAPKANSPSRSSSKSARHDMDKTAAIRHALANAVRLEDALSKLPLGLLDGDADTLAALHAIGATTIGDVLALPRDGVARRFGQRLIDDIDRALGRLPDPRTFFQPPVMFHASIELPVEVTQTEALLFAARRLLVQLAGFLNARSSGVQRIDIKLAHRDIVTKMTIGMLAPSRDAARFTLLLREQLAKLALREPVLSLAVAASDVVPLSSDNLSLLIDDAGGEAQIRERLIERLRARLGNDAIHGLAMKAEHRPEQVNALAEPGTKQLALNFGERPFWLLAAPQPIHAVGVIPHHDGPLELLSGPERIESGWWDGSEAMRDYFIARTPNRSLLWIYRERRLADAGGWYLHGIFA